MLLPGCGKANETSSSDESATDSTEPTTDEGPTTTAETVTAPPTAPPTTAPDPTVFNPQNVGNLLDLASFVLTVDESHSNNGALDQRTTTASYVKDPLNVYVVSDYGEFGIAQDYVGAGRTYQNDHQGYWYLYEDGSLATPYVLYPIQESTALIGVTTATFAGEEEFAGVPSYHFTFDETNLENGTTYTGDFYLARQGNYLLYAHSLMMAAGEGYELIDEFTETLSSVNQLTEFALPDDMVPLKDALDLGIQFGIPMPADGVLDSMINYNDGGIGVYYYQYTSTWKNNSEFLEFYQNLPPTNGWTVTHIGLVRNYDNNCSGGNCVIIKNGDKQVILYFDGSNLHADFDREHRFSPCTQPVAPPEFCG